MLHCGEDNPPIIEIGEQVDPTRRLLKLPSPSNVNKVNIGPLAVWVVKQHSEAPDEHCWLLTGGLAKKGIANCKFSSKNEIFVFR